MEAHAPIRPPPGRPMLELDFTVQGAAPVQYAAAPTIGFELAIESRGSEPIRSVVLHTQIQIAARRRSYGDGEQQRLGDLFGEPQRWSDTLRTLPWLRTTQVVPGFTGQTARPTTACPWACGARRWIATSPAARGFDWTGTPSTACTRTGHGMRCRAGNTPWTGSSR